MQALFCRMVSCERFGFHILSGVRYAEEPPEVCKAALLRKRIQADAGGLLLDPEAEDQVVDAACVLKSASFAL